MQAVPTNLVRIDFSGEKSDYVLIHEDEILKKAEEKLGHQVRFNSLAAEKLYTPKDEQMVEEIPKGAEAYVEVSGSEIYFLLPAAS